MYKNLFRSLVFSLLFTLPMIAYAVDGVGIFEFFPALGIIVRFLFFSAAVVVLAIGFTANENKQPSIRRRVIAVAFAAPMLYFVAEPAISTIYLNSLCRNEAAVQADVRSEDWSPSVPSSSIRSQSQRRDGGWEANVAPDLLEYNSVVDRAFGVQWVSYRLSDQRTQKVLLSASYFSNRSKGPMSCEAATMYWKLRMQFTKKAWAGGKTPSGT
ncbi:hypothetical protein [Polaromonas sp. LjRoot131]|uniref:hypothetical protein n=1 Tax=Polaromonas sp. LjRoot131 TaxID=3342262 RepID=UPI003ECD20B4